MSNDNENITQSEADECDGSVKAENGMLGLCVYSRVGKGCAATPSVREKHCPKIERSIELEDE